MRRITAILLIFILVIMTGCSKQQKHENPGGTVISGEKEDVPSKSEKKDEGKKHQNPGGTIIHKSEAEESAKSSDPVLIPSKNIVFGETIKTDYCEIVIKNIEFTYELKPPKTSGMYFSYPAENGKVYIHIDATCKNTSKKDMCVRDLPIATADYNSGYQYIGFNVVNDGDKSFDWAMSTVVAEPLTTCTFHGLIECPKEVDESSNPVIIMIPIDDIVYTYKLK